MRSSAAWASFPALVLASLAACERNGDFQSEFIALGTVVSVTAYDTEAERFDAAVAALERHLQVAGTAWYPRADGELAALNSALAEGRGAEVSPALLSLLRSAQDFERRSGGRFDACLARLSDLWGFYDLPDAPSPDFAAVEAVAGTKPSCLQLEIDAEAKSVRSRNPNVAVDVGGIAKGTLLEDARRMLLDHGIGNGIVNLGGDLIVIGRVDGRDVRIGIRSPDGSAPMAGLDVHSGEAVFTSGNYERFVTVGGKRFAHILDPATGYPVEHTVSVSVVHTDPVLADAAATALIVGGTAAFDELVAAFGLEFAMLVDAKGDVRLTSGMARRVHWTDRRRP
jgi:thiamine biosynthesis lipoprotein